MNINILKQEKQPLLSRIEVSAKVEFKGSTPSREELKKGMAIKLKQKEELTVIKHIYNEFGAQEAEVEAFIYDDKKVMSILEKEKKKKDSKPVAEKPIEKGEGDPKEKQKEQTEEKLESGQSEVAQKEKKEQSAEKSE